MKIFELPDQLCANGKPAVALLVDRPDSLTVSHSIYLGENASVGDPVTYTFVGTNTRFAQHGTLIADYPATTRTIDQTIKAVVQFDGPDYILDEQTLFRALANEMLCIIDDEIMSVAFCELVAAKTYRLSLVRSRFGTVRASHAAGTEVYLIPLSSLMAVQHSYFEPGNTVFFKVTASAPNLSEDLADVDPISITLSGSAFKLPPVSLLRIEGATRNPSFRLIGDISIDWKLPASGAVDLSRAYTLLEFIEAGIVVHTEHVAVPASALEYDYPAVRPETFTLRASLVIERDWETITSPTVELTAYHAEY